MCTRPLKAFPIGLTENNKTKYYITSYSVDHVEITQNIVKPVYDKERSLYCEKVVREFKEIPCGQCLECRLEYSRVWANRCFLEMKEHEKSYFITLTYDDEHLPLNQYVDYDTGVTGTIATLQKRDWQLFMKRLRKEYRYCNKLRFFAAGEYGDHTYRPHYHAIIFGLILDDLELLSVSKHNFPLYKSEFLNSVWQNGNCVVAHASWDTCAYTARYIMKKQKGKAADVYSRYNFEPEFLLMSRKPGIGRKAFDRDPYSWFDTNFHSYSTDSGSVNVSVCRYFKRLMSDIDSSFVDQYTNYKESLHTAEVKARIKQSSKSYLELLADDELVLSDRVKALKRQL